VLLGFRYNLDCIFSIMICLIMFDFVSFTQMTKMASFGLTTPQTASVVGAVSAKKKQRRSPKAIQNWAEENPRGLAYLTDTVLCNRGSKRNIFISNAFQEGLARGLWSQADEQIVKNKYDNLCRDLAAATKSLHPK